ncbi:MAG: hypothetical protein ACXABY_15975 [Candidatus Thorarchaeota archaeon]|jgi:hypothetical protein
MSSILKILERILGKAALNNPAVQQQIQQIKQAEQQALLAQQMQAHQSIHLGARQAGKAQSLQSLGCPPPSTVQYIPPAPPYPDDLKRQMEEYYRMLGGMAPPTEEPEDTVMEFSKLEE